jgi:hypothetical protein
MRSTPIRSRRVNGRHSGIASSQPGVSVHKVLLDVGLEDRGLDSSSSVEQSPGEEEDEKGDDGDGGEPGEGEGCSCETGFEIG